MAVRNSQVKGPANRRAFDRLHVRVVRPVAALRRGPCDVLAGSLMSQVLQCTQFWKLIWKRVFALFCRRIRKRLQGSSARRARVFRQVDVDRHDGVFQRQVRGLAFLVVGEGERHVGQAVKRQFAVGFG